MVAVGRAPGLEQQRPQRPRHGPVRRRAQRSSFRPALKEVSGQWTVADWSPDETRVVAVEYISINESYIHIIEVATGKTETITPRRGRPQGRADFAADAPQWSKDGRSIYYITDQGSEFRRLVHHDLASGHIETLTDNISWDVEEFDLSDDGTLIAWVANEDGRRAGSGWVERGRAGLERFSAAT